MKNIIIVLSILSICILSGCSTTITDEQKAQIKEQAVKAITDAVKDQVSK